MLTKPKNWFLRLWYYRARKKAEKINRKLEMAIINKIEERRAIKKEVEAHIELKLKEQKSDYIPPNVKREILEYVYQQFGERMRAVELHLKPNLHWSA